MEAEIEWIKENYRWKTNPIMDLIQEKWLKEQMLARKLTIKWVD